MKRRRKLQSSKAIRRGKRAEREVARLTNGERYAGPVRPDVKSGWGEWIEVKSRQGLPAWFKDALDEALARGCDGVLLCDGAKLVMLPAVYAGAEEDLPRLYQKRVWLLMPLDHKIPKWLKGWVDQSRDKAGLDQPVLLYIRENQPTPGRPLGGTFRTLVIPWEDFQGYVIGGQA